MRRESSDRFRRAVGLVACLLSISFAVGCATTTFRHGSTDAWTPAYLHRDRYVYLRGSIAGARTEMLLDSGAAFTVMDEDLARKLRLSVRWRTTVSGVSGVQHGGGWADRKVAIEVGGMRLPAVRVFILDLDAVGEALGRPLPVILGVEAFRDAVVDIDYENSRVCFRPPGSYVYDGPGTTLPTLRSRNGRRILQLEVDGRPAAPFLIDTGSGNALHCYPGWSRRQRLPEDSAAVSTTMTAGVGGRRVSRVTSLRRVKMGPYVLEDVPAVLGSVGVSGSGATAGRHVGLLGAQILRRYRVIFDFRRDRLHLHPARETNPRQFSRGLIGLQALPSGNHLRVLHVARGSPAEAAGFLEDDVLTAVEGATDVQGMLRLLRSDSHKPGQRLTIRDSGGRERTITLKRYY